MWALDPIDGTKGFLRGEQFAVCLALIVDGQVQVGVMGCPNLPVDAKDKDGEKGCLFITVKGQGAFQVRHIFCQLIFDLLSSRQSPFFSTANVVISFVLPKNEIKGEKKKKYDLTVVLTLCFLSLFFPHHLLCLFY